MVQTEARMTRVWGIVLMVLLLAACGDMHEAKGVRLAMGLRLDEQVADNARANDLEASQKLGLSVFQLEIPLEADIKTGLPQLNRVAKAELTKLLPELKRRNCAYALMIPHLNQHQLFRGDTIPNPLAWFRAYQRELKSLFEQQIPNDNHPLWIVLGQDIQPYEKQDSLWATTASLVRGYGVKQVLYSALPARVGQIRFWKSMDAIGIRYLREDLDQPKAYARLMHPKLDSIADRLGKPVFITSANLLGPEKLLQYRNLLRFWPKNRLKILVFNTIYAFSPLSDSQSQYAWQSDEALIDEIARQNTPPN
jgi:hypothetical protein